MVSLSACGQIYDLDYNGVVASSILYERCGIGGLMTEIAIAPDRPAPAIRVQPELLRLLDVLPAAKQDELLDFARFLYQQTADRPAPLSPRDSSIELRTAPATTLAGLTGLVQLGGDAVADVEALYDDDRNH
jgi:hypothetical protein